MRVDFYHLVRSPLERVLPAICERVLGQNERLLIVASPDDLARIDRQLWAWPADSFLPHGREGASQPVLLSSEPEPVNGAVNIALADGLWRDEALSFARAFYFFDEATIEGARQSWRALKGNPDVEARYWKQDGDGRWVEGP